LLAEFLENGTFQVSDSSVHTLPTAVLGVFGIQFPHDDKVLLFFFPSQLLGLSGLKVKPHYFVAAVTFIAFINAL
jgi:hypothetical protein